MQGRAAIEAEGFKVHPVPFVRGRLAPLATWRTILALRRLRRQIAPAVSHHVAIQAAVLGSLAAIGQPGAQVNALTGFGYAFIARSPKARMLRAAIGVLLRRLIDRPDAVALVQNPDDRQDLLALGIAAIGIVLIAGSGVDIGRFAVARPPGSGLLCRPP